MIARAALDGDRQRFLRAAVREETWTEEELVLLGQLPDADVARKIRRTTSAVRQKREGLGRRYTGTLRKLLCWD
jgi:hypothetical protein